MKKTLKSALKTVLESETDGSIRYMRVAEGLVKQAENGNLAAFSLIREVMGEKAADNFKVRISVDDK